MFGAPNIVPITCNFDAPNSKVGRLPDLRPQEFWLRGLDLNQRSRLGGIMSPFLAYTRYHAKQLNPSESAKLTPFRCSLLFAFVPRSCTVRAQFTKLRVYVSLAIQIHFATLAGRRIPGTVTGDYNREQETEFSREKLGTAIPNRLRELLESVQRRELPSGDWFAILATNILTSVARVCRDLRQTIEQKDALPAAARNARNLLELWIWIEYCTASRENAKRFYEDALRDALGLAESLSKMCKLTGTVNEFGDQARRKLVEIALNDHGIESLDKNYEQVLTAATNVGLDEWYKANNAHLSKFAHPTAIVVVGLMHHSETVIELQATCTTLGLCFAGQCVMALERMVAKIP